jgi:hypothetical protein
MNDDTRQLERLLHDTMAATAASAPSEAGAWHGFQACRRRRATIVKAGAGLAFAAIVGAAVLLPSWAGTGGGGGGGQPVTPAASTPPATYFGGEIQPTGLVLRVGSGTVAGQPWSYSIGRGPKGEVCTRWDVRGVWSCSGGDLLAAAQNPYYDETGNKGLGTAIEGVMPPRTVRVRLELSGREPLELATIGGRELRAAAYATVLPYRAKVTRITAYDAAGKVLFDDKHPYNTPWPGEPDTRP